MNTSAAAARLFRVPGIGRLIQGIYHAGRSLALNWGAAPFMRRLPDADGQLNGHRALQSWRGPCR